MQAEIIDPGDSNRASSDEEYSAMDLLYLRAMGAMLEGKDADDVAATVGYSDRQIRNWKKTERWRELWNQVAGHQVGLIRAQVIGLGGKSVKMLRSLLEDSSAKGAPTQAYVAFGILDRIRHVVPTEDDAQIRRIISRVPRSAHTPAIPAEEADTPPAAPSERARGQLDAPENYGLPVGNQVRQSVMRQVREERKQGIYQGVRSGTTPGE